MDNILDVKEINVFYGDIQALREISIKVEEGELIALIGSNGAGKTTFIKTLSGLLAPKSGEIIFLNEKLNGLHPHEITARGIVQVPEGRRLFPSMTIQENLDMGSYLKKAQLKKESNLKMINDLFPILKERKSQLAGTLSGGEQQMLAIARSLMADPKLLLIDEFSLGLAPVIVEKLYDIIKELKKKFTILLVEQNVPLALSIADRAYVMENGRITLEGKASELLHSDSIRKTYLGI